MPTFRQNALALLALLSFPACATDYFVEYSGGLPPAPINGRLNDDIFLGDVDPTFHRPRDTCEDTSDSNNYRYDTITLTNTGGNEVDVDLNVSTGFCDPQHDSVVYGYSPLFVPDHPNTNCFVSNDDYQNQQNRCSFISTAVAPNQTVVFVIASYDADLTWPWTATFNDRVYDDDFECLSVDDFNCGGSP